MFTICNLRGLRLLNSSIASAMSTGMSRCTVRSVNPVSLCVVIDDRKGDLIRFRLLKDLSAEQLVTGRVHRILISALTFGSSMQQQDWKANCFVHDPLDAAATSSASSVTVR